MKNTKQCEIYNGIDDYEENCYLFSQSVSKRRIVSGKSYYVRSYFKGGKDFEKTVEWLATKLSHKNAG